MSATRACADLRHLLIWSGSCRRVSSSRSACDFGIPLINNAKLGVLFVQSLEKKIPQGSLDGYVKGRKPPPEVRPWSSWVGGHP